MGLPEINITFTERAYSTIKRGSKGTVVLVLHHNAVNTKSKSADTSQDILQSVHTMYRFNDLDELGINLTDRQKQYIELAFLGADNPPEKVILLMRGTDESNYTKVFKTLDTMQFNYIAFPEMTSELNTIVSWVKSSDTPFIAVLGNSASDCEKIVNFTSEKILTTLSEEMFSTVEFTSRIAGLLAGTSLNKSATYKQLSEVQDFEKLNKTSMDTAINNGQFILYYDGEKTKVARGVTSFVSVDLEKGEQFKKVKLVEAMQLIKKDITTTCEDMYIGKYANTYANKCIIITAINNYFDELAKDGVLNPDSSNLCEINIELQRSYLKGIGIDVNSLSDDEIKRYDTGDKVFLSATISLLDAMEDITLDITI